MTRRDESGQALVLILLSLSVVLTLILFILSRSITDVAVSSRQEEAVRAFSAAEAGIERALITSADYTNEAIGNAVYTTTTIPFAFGSYDLPFPSPVSYGDTVTAWFVSHGVNDGLTCDGAPCFTGDQMKVCWGNPNTSYPDANVQPAVEVSIYYESTPGQLSTIKIARIALDPNTGRRDDNYFSAPDPGTCMVGEQVYDFQKTISFGNLGIPPGSRHTPNGLQFAQIRVLYNSDAQHLVGISVNFPGGSTLPSQGKQIDSSGSAGDSNRRVIYYQGWPEFPFASNAIVSPVGITK
jgi:hypothetical protein